MYYSCLNGNWNADGDEIYGEESDDVDYFPEVFVGRISANTTGEIASYIDRLISYEKGELDCYTRAGGFSMDLWSGSDSEVCQQYIYEQYFPDFYEITLLYDADNSMQNAFNLLNENINIVQHTGHAGSSSLSLVEGNISVTNLSNLTNESGEIFYSIGCWSAAIDNNSVGEALVMREGKGQLAYIGNSRYGWGAPAASGFGFSEFFQKEFFKQIFWNGISIISETNALQKLPFVPFFGGTSVYKWVAYQLNEVGDSYFNLITEDPLELDFSIECTENLRVVVTSDGIPLENVVVTAGENQELTNSSGEATLPNNADTLFLYKYGYTFAEIDVNEYQPAPFISDISGATEIFQGQAFQIGSILYNPTSENISFSVEYEFDGSEISISNNPYTSSVEANSNIDLHTISGYVLPIEDSDQMELGKEITVTQNIFDIDNELLTKNSIIFTILAPEVTLKIVERPDNITPGSNASFCYEFINTGDFTLDFLDINFISGSEYYEFEDTATRFEYPIPAGQRRNLEDWIIFVLEDAPADYVGDYSIEYKTGFNLNSSVYTFREELILPIGILSWNDDFEDGLKWNCPTEWQLVDTYASSGNLSFSCRPNEVGVYTASAPSFVYTNDLQLSLNYKYKMPMYGEDGVFFILEYDSTVDTLIFLGAGGALPENDYLSRTPEVYIEDDWVEYNLKLDELILDELEIGMMITCKLMFNYTEEIIAFNQYSVMNEIGVFIDDFSISEIKSENENEEPEFEDEILYTYPNPVYSNGILNIAYSSSNLDEVSVKIYNIKGQQVKEINRGSNQSGIICWDLKDEYKRPISSGIYLIKLKTGKITSLKKMLLIK